MNGENNMNAKRFTARAPGKLFVAGEYAVTEPNQDSIVVAVDRYLSVDIQRAHTNRLDLLDLQLTDVSWNVKENEVIFSEQDERLNFVKSVMETFIDYVNEYEPTHIVVTSELDSESGKKYGLGSSAALSVALLTALFKFSDHSQNDIDQLTIFKLASIAHFQAQGNGSCADIAASTYGGWLNYRSFDAEWLVNQLEEGRPVKELVEDEWPSLKIVPLKSPDYLEFIVGWTQETAQTGPMVAKVHQLKAEQPDVYQFILNSSQKAVEQMIKGFTESDSELVFYGMSENRDVLRKLGAEAAVSIETPILTKLIDAVANDGAAKSSGAGGGDCGVAFVKDKDVALRVYQLWSEAGIEPLDINISPVGVEIN